MSYSELATKYIPAHSNNYYGPRTKEITKAIVHHMVAVWTAERCAETFQDPYRGASANYCIGNDGSIVCSLDESYIPATSSSYEADSTAVTIEVSNSIMGEPWTISEAAMKSLILLLADIAKRNKGIGSYVKGENLCWHSMYAATICPGDYLRSKMGYIADEANKLNYEKDVFDGTYDGIDTQRKTNEMILYFKGIHGDGYTGTNQWGYEVQIDKYGVVLANPHYSGNTKIPEGGKVLSGHGESGKWIYNNIDQGDLVWFKDYKTHIVKGVRLSVNSVNGPRNANHLVVYNEGGASNTNEYGTEVAVDKNGKASAPVYGVGKMKIPEGGFVLSGHGTASTWLWENIRKGKTVTFNGKYVVVE